MAQSFEEKWVQRFIKLAHEVSKWSSDQTGVGSVIVGKDKNIISTGYNGTPRHVEETKFRKSQEFKKYYIEHSERNAIFLAKSSLDGASIFTTHHPCADCARAIIQTGIKEIYYCEEMTKPHWIDNMEASKIMLKEAGVETFQIQRQKNTQESSFAVVEHSSTGNLSSDISLTSECRLPTTVQLSTETQKAQILWPKIGRKKTPSK